MGTERVFLVKAVSWAAARRKALTFCRSQLPQNGFTLGGRPAAYAIGGVRKVVECEDWERRPGDGTEIAFSTYTLPTKAELTKFMSHKHVKLVYEEWKCVTPCTAKQKRHNE
jgi:hypothetical protein